MPTEKRARKLRAPFACSGQQIQKQIQNTPPECGRHKSTQHEAKAAPGKE